jgi:small subunit ribosomal protein S2
MRPYIFGSRNLIHIIDIKATVKGLIRACHFLENVAQRNELVLFVGTKRQAGSVIETEARRCGMPFVAQRWIGGSLTNYMTIRSRLRRLEEIEQWEKDGTIHRYNKKELSSIMREKRKLVRNLEGIRTMDRLPAALVLVDPRHEQIAVAEANKIKAATIALIDTDGNPDEIDIPVPGNDDSMKVVQIIVAQLADAVLAGKAKAIPVPVEEKKEESGKGPDVVSIGRRDLRGPRSRMRIAGGLPPAPRGKRPPKEKPPQPPQPAQSAPSEAKPKE